MYHRYDSLITIENLFNKGRILSAFTVNGVNGYVNLLFVASLQLKSLTRTSDTCSSVNSELLTRD